MNDVTDSNANAAGQSEHDGDEAANNPKPLGVFELFDIKGFRDDNSSTNPSTETINPSKEETLGQNQLADIISDVLRDEMAWDSASGQCFKRAAVDKPFVEHDGDASWLAISEQIALIKPKYTAGFVSGVERFVKARLSIEQWNNHRRLLPVSNGVLDLGTGTLRKYRPDDRFNWQLPYKYQPTATCPLIDMTLARMVGNDPALVDFLNSWLLVVLLGRYDVQAFLELVGKGGTGKSTFLRLLAFLVGDENVRSTDLYSLECNQFEPAALYGKRLTIISDSARYRGEVPVLKSITGGDPVRLERKHQQQRKPYVYQGLVAIAANQPLESSDYSSGLKRRRRSLTIDYVLSDLEKKPYRCRIKYPDGFEGELKREMPGLLNRLLALDVDEAVNRIASPDEAMQAQNLSIELETNPLLAWADENLVRCTSGETQIGNKSHEPGYGLYSNYCEFVEANGQKPVSLTRFSRALLDILQAHGISTSKKFSKFTFLSGLRLRQYIDGHERLVSGSKYVSEGLEARNCASEEFEQFEGLKHSSEFPDHDSETRKAPTLTLDIGTEGQF